MNPRKTIFWMAIAFAVVNLIACSPFLVSSAASYILESHGCRIDPSPEAECLLRGRNWGPALSEIHFSAGLLWLGFAPFGAIASLIWAFVALFLWLKFQFESRHRWAAFISGNYSKVALWLAAIPAFVAFLINAPVYTAIAVRTLSQQLGCPVHGSPVKQCIVFGSDVFPVLKAIYRSSLGVMPVGYIGSAALLIWAIVAVFFLIGYLARRLFRQRSGR
jgi:hypothetical protein